MISQALASLYRSQCDPNIRELYDNVFIILLLCFKASSFSNRNGGGKVGKSAYTMGMQDKCTRAYEGDGVKFSLLWLLSTR